MQEITKSSKELTYITTEFGRIPSKWNYEILDNFLELITYGFTNPMPTTKEGPFMVTAKDVKDSKINYDTARHTSYDAFRLLTDKSRPILNDVLITKDGTIGRVAIVDSEDICINQSVALLRPNKRIRAKFLKYILESPAYQKMIERDTSGSTIKHIYITRINKMLIGVPDLEEQDSILSILSTLDDKIELNLQMTKTLEEMAMTLYKFWFVDFGPFQDGEFVESELGMIPKGWEVKTIGDIAKIVGGYAFKSKDFSIEGEKVIKIKNISNNVVSIEGSDCIPLSVASKTNIKFTIEPGSYLVAMTGAEVGKVGIVPDYQERLWLNQRVGMIAMAEFEYAEILVGNFLQSEECYGIIQNLAYGSAQPNISSSGLEGIKILLPKDVSIIRKYLENLKCWDEMKVTNYTENNTLTTLRDTLLPKLISGEVRVKEAVKALAAVL